MYRVAFDDEVTRLQMAALASVRGAAPDKKQLFSELPLELRGRIYRSPTSSAHDLAIASRNHEFSRMVNNGASLLEELIHVHPLWRSRIVDRKRPTYVHLPSRAIRERVFRATESGAILVELGDGLLLFLAKLAKVVGRLSDLASASSIEALLSIQPSTLSVFPEPSEQVRDLLSSIALCGHPGLAPSPAVGPHAQKLASQLSTAMFLFVASRSMVHALRDDVREASAVSGRFQGFQAQELLFDLHREVEADQEAWDLMAWMCQRQGIPTGIVAFAPCLFFQGALAVQRTFEVIGYPGGSLVEWKDGEAVLPPFASERFTALADSVPDRGGLRSVVGRHAAWAGEILESLRTSSRTFFDRCRELGLAVGAVARPDPRVFWLTPMIYDGERRTVKPLYQAEDHARAEAICQHVGQLDHLRPYVRPYERDVVICFRASLYLESARRLGALLRAAGVNASHDELFVPPGTDWEPQLRKAIGSTRMVVMLMSLTDLGSGTMEDPRAFPVMKEIRWVRGSGTRFFIAGVSHLAVEAEAGAIFRSTIDILRTAADGSFVRENFPVLMVHSEDGSLPAEIDPILAKDVQEELALTA